MVSSAFFMLLEQGAKVFADCAIVEDPTAEQLAEIGAASAVTAASFGLIPRVAMLSYATGDSNTGPMTSKVGMLEPLPPEASMAACCSLPHQCIDTGETRGGGGGRMMMRRFLVAGGTHYHQEYTIAGSACIGQQ